MNYHKLSGIVVLVLTNLLSACALKSNITPYDYDEGLVDSGAFDTLELEVAVPIADADALQYFGSLSRTTGESEGSISTNLGDLSRVSTNLKDVRFGARYAPWSHKEFWLQPAFGAGLGYFNVTTTTRSGGDRLSGCSFGFTCRELHESERTQAKGFYPFASLIIEREVTDGWHLFVEGRFDARKQDDDADYSSGSVLFGIRYTGF